MDLIFLIDFKRNTYKFSKFKLNYNSAICYQDEEGSQVNTTNATNANNENEKEKNKPNYFKYGIPIALGVGGIVAAPFLLGALGGKNKKLKLKKTKKNKRKYK